MLKEDYTGRCKNMGRQIWRSKSVGLSIAASESGRPSHSFLGDRSIPFKSRKTTKKVQQPGTPRMVVPAAGRMSTSRQREGSANMSVKSAKAFLKRMNTDKAFAKRVNGCKDAKARADLVKAEGYEFSNQELYSLQELGDQDLANVVGGALRTKAPCGGYQYAECC